MCPCRFLLQEHMRFSAYIYLCAGSQISYVLVSVRGSPNLKLKQRDVVVLYPTIGAKNMELCEFNFRIAQPPIPYLTVDLWTSKEVADI